MSLNFCDLLVLGSDLSGIITATLLAKRGMNVLVLDDESDQEPISNVAVGLGSRAFRSLLGKLMIPDSKLQILHENKIGCQIIFPKNRLDLHTNRVLFLREIEREFPQEKTVVEELFGEIDQLRENHLETLLSFFPVVDDKEKKKFIRWYETFPSQKVLSIWEKISPTLQCFFRAQLRFFSRSPLLDQLALQFLLFLPPEGDATYSVRGGVRELKRLFFDKLDYFGGMVHPLGQQPFQIINQKKEIKGIQMGRYNFPTRCRYLLGNMNIQSIYRELPSHFISFLFGRDETKVLSMKPQERHYLLQYHIAREVIPEPMQDNVILISDPNAPLEGANSLELNLQAFPKGAVNGFDTLLTVSFKLPGDGINPVPLESLRNEVDQKVRRFIPFAREQLEMTYPKSPEKIAHQAPELFPDENSEPPWEKIGEKYVSYPPSLFTPQMTTPYPNFFMTGPHILQWLGMEGKLLAALKAVDLIWAKELKVRNT
ncbi:MAG: hypothetical protein HY073_00180 [Deltaproteobacteria bacterium]|nr:hypothetical protein [Deltaproteobacteria bacterium]